MMGEAKVLSTTVRALCSWASLLSSARSITAQIGLAGVSAYSSFVLGLTAFLWPSSIMRISKRVRVRARVRRWVEFYR